MKTASLANHRVVLEFTIEELAIIKNALNEVCHGIEIEEFQTRMGEDMETVKQLLDQIWDITKDLDSS
jgi:hypothetical protein